MNSTTPSADRAILCMSSSAPDPDAVHFAEQIIHAFGMQLILLYTPRDTAELTEGHRSLEMTRQLLQTEPDGLIEIRGDLESVLAEELDPGSHELVILGTSAEGFDRRTTMMSRRLASRIGDSVLIIQHPSKHIRRILVCTGGHPAANIVIERGLQLGKALDAEVTILHVTTSMPTMYTGLPAVEEGLQQILSRDTPLAGHLRAAARMAEENGVKAKLELRHGIVTEEILRACEMEDFHLLVIGSPEPRRVFDVLALGRIGPQLLTSAKIPLMIARIEPKER
jgi:nucleotide-binding universal stress UspA family protein